MQPGMAPGGQGEAGLPSEGVHHLNRGASGKGGVPPGIPFPPPSPHKEEAPTCSTNFSWRWRLCGGAPGWEEMGHPPWPLMWGGEFLVRGTWLLLSDFLVLWVFQGHWPVVPSQVGVGGDGVGGVVIEGLHSPPSSSTNVDEVASQGSPEDHFLFRPQDFPKQPPP